MNLSYVSRIHQFFYIVFANWLWIYYPFREYNLTRIWWYLNSAEFIWISHLRFHHILVRVYTKYTIYVSRNNQVFYICFGNSLWINYLFANSQWINHLFRGFTLNSLSVSQIHFESITFYQIHSELLICFANWLWTYYLFR